MFWAVLAVLLVAPAFCAEPKVLEGARWALKDSPAGLLLLDTQTGNVWVLKTNQTGSPTELRFERIPRDGEKINQSTEEKTPHGDSRPTKIEFSHGNNPKEFDPTRPNP